MEKLDKLIKNKDNEEEIENDDEEDEDEDMDEEEIQDIILFNDEGSQMMKTMS